MTFKPIIAALGVALLLTACARFETAFPPIPIEQYEKGAEKGEAFAQMQLGQYLLVTGLEKSENGAKSEDLKKAIYWLEKAAAQDEPYAIYLLGTLRERGVGFEKDMKAAHGFYMRAAMLDNPPGQEALSRFYALGVLGRPDYIESHKWHIVSQRHEPKFFATDFLARNRLTKQQLELAEMEAAKITDQFKGS